MVLIALTLGACGAELESVDKLICQSSSRINDSFIVNVDRERFIMEADKLGDLAADKGASPEVAGPALAVHLAAPQSFDGDEGFNRSVDAVQALNEVCMDAGL